MRADLHVHTYCSDGGQSPADVVAAAKKRGVDIVSVTDHDNSNAVKEFSALARAAGIIPVAGEEISAYDGDVKVHILGYGMDEKSESYKSFHKKISDGAERRTFDILQKLAASGIKIAYNDVIRERRCPLSPIHAMYIAVAGARKGYAGSPVDFYMRYLNYGRAGFSCIGRPTSEETVLCIKESGGISSLAHPGRISLNNPDLIALIERLVPLGLGGIEAVYSGHTEWETQYFKELAARYNLLVTGGSDTHFAEGNRAVGEPEFHPDGRLLAALKII